MFFALLKLPCSVAFAALCRCCLASSSTPTTWYTAVSLVAYMNLSVTANLTAPLPPCARMQPTDLCAALHDERTRVRVPTCCYDPLVGAQPDGSWRSVSAAIVQRICTQVLTSAGEGALDEDAARMLTR